MSSTDRPDRQRPHPAKGRCAATTKNGSRCLKDAVADGLCKLHWRMAYDREQAAANKRADASWAHVP